MIMLIKLFRRLLNMAYSFSISVLTFIFDSCVITLVRQSAHTAGVAIVRLDAIGDFILWLDAAKEFRKLYQHTKITLIANQVWSDLARLLPYWDDVIPVDRKKLTMNLPYRFKTLQKIRSLCFETAIQPVLSREYLTGDCLIRATGAVNKIGFTGDLNNMTSWQKKISDKWYSQLITAKDEPLMELQRNAEFMIGIGVQNFSARIPKIPKLFDLPPQLKMIGPYYVIAPGASQAGKLWPFERFAEVLKRVANLTGFMPVACGSKEEYALCNDLIVKADVESVNLAGHTTLPELVEIIRHAEILISNDSSFVHIAATVKTNAVCILGGGHFGRFMPYAVETGDYIAPVPVYQLMDCFNCNWKCTRPHDKGKAMPCISDITVEQVMRAVEEIATKWDGKNLPVRPAG